MNIRENLQYTYEQLDLTIESQRRAVLVAASIFEQVAHKVALAVLYFLKGALYSFSLGQIHSVLRSSIPPSSTPMLPQEVVTNAIDSVTSEKKIKETLDKWISEGAPEEKRQEAADKILECFFQRHTQLNLPGFHLRSLPACIGDLTQLTALHLYKNQLTSIPVSIGNLTSLTTLSLGENQLTEINNSIYSLTKLTCLDLQRNQLTEINDSIGNLTQLKILNLESNQLTSIPPRMLQLSKDCLVPLFNNPLSGRVLNQLRAPRDTGPKFFVSMEQQENKATAFLDLDRLIDFWSSLTPNASKARPISNLEPRKKSLLTNFLRRLGEVQEYRNAKTRPILAQRVIRFLKAFAESKKFRRLSLQIIEESLATCGDRVGLGLLRIECLWKILASQRISLQEVAKLAVGMKRLQMLETIAREKVKNLYFIDEVEVYLAYMTKLAPSLALPIDSQDMLFFKISGVTKEDLQIAHKTLIEETSYPNQIIEDLLQFEPWIQKIREDFKEELSPKIAHIEQDIQAKTDLLEKEKSAIPDQEYHERYKTIAEERSNALQSFYRDITKKWLQKHYTQLLEAINPTTTRN